MLRQGSESVLELLAKHAGVLLKPVLVDDVHYGEPRRHAYRVPAERIEVDALSERLSDLHSRRDSAERHAVADSLRHGDEIGDDVEVLESPVVVPGASEAGLNFVGDAEAAMIAGDLVRLA